MLGDMAAVVLESQKISALKIQEDGYKFKYSDIDSAVADLLA